MRQSSPSSLVAVLACFIMASSSSTTTTTLAQVPDILRPAVPDIQFVTFQNIEELNTDMTKLTKIAAELSSEVYVPEPATPLIPEGITNMTVFETGLASSNERALLAHYDGRCVLSFRGNSINPTIETIAGIIQLSEPGVSEVCREGAASGGAADCCMFRNGWAGALLDSGIIDEVYEELESCVDDCEDLDNCVILTGHSKGGAMATAAAVYWADLNPMVITFGAPTSVVLPCAPLDTNRVYRFVNSDFILRSEDEFLGPRVSDLFNGVTGSIDAGLTVLGGLIGTVGGQILDDLSDTVVNDFVNAGVSIVDDVILADGRRYDLVPMAPRVGNTMSVGHLLILTEDATGIAYLGTDVAERLLPNCVTCQAMSRAQTGQRSEIMGTYRDRIDDLYAYAVENSGLTIATTGYGVGTGCVQNDECRSNRCVQGFCAPLLERCGPCTLNEECVSGSCSDNRFLRWECLGRFSFSLGNICA